MSDETATASDAADEGLLKRAYWAIKARIDPDGNLPARVMLTIYKILRWVAVLVIIGFISIIAWLAVGRSGARDEVETLRQEVETLHQEKEKLQAKNKSDSAALNSTIALHQQHQVSLRKHNMELVQTSRGLREALLKKSTVRPPRPVNKQLKADLKQSLERSMLLQKRLERLNAAPTARNNASLRAKADADHGALSRCTKKLDASNRKTGQLEATQLKDRLAYRDLQLEMEMLKAREGVEQWGQNVPLAFAYYKCKAKSGDTVKLRRLASRPGAALSIDLFPGEGSRRGLFITDQTHYLPSGLYDIEIWKNYKRVSVSKYPLYLSPRPRQKYIVCPDGRRLRIQHQGNLNLILLSTKSYRLSSLPRSP